VNTKHAQAKPDQKLAIKQVSAISWFLVLHDGHYLSSWKCCKKWSGLLCAAWYKLSWTFSILCTNLSALHVSSVAFELNFLPTYHEINSMGQSLS
jgi:hypothetical protein